MLNMPRSYYNESHREFTRNLRDATVSNTVISQYVKMFWALSSISGSKKTRRMYVLTDEELDKIGVELDSSESEKSPAWLAQQAGMSASAYKTNRTVACNSTKYSCGSQIYDTDRERRLNFTSW